MTTIDLDTIIHEKNREREIIFVTILDVERRNLTKKLKTFSLFIRKKNNVQLPHFHLIRKEGEIGICCSCLA